MRKRILLYLAGLALFAMTLSAQAPVSFGGDPDPVCPPKYCPTEP
ncbi:MAG TPA: hypothetical protein VLE48_06405 [Terriglobales bacterium]|nr:hypothetical protein [Terriglobales bacterium]